MHRSTSPHPLSTPLPPSIVPLILTAVPLHHRETTALGTRVRRGAELEAVAVGVDMPLLPFVIYEERERDSEYERGRSGRW